MAAFENAQIWLNCLPTISFSQSLACPDHINTFNMVYLKTVLVPTCNVGMHFFFQ